MVFAWLGKINYFQIFYFLNNFQIYRLPYGILSLIGQFSSEREKYVTPKTSVLPLLLAKFSTISNPFIYLFTNQKFKDYLKSKLRFVSSR